LENGVVGGGLVPKDRNNIFLDGKFNVAFLTSSKVLVEVNSYRLVNLEHPTTQPRMSFE
jgi:hypothetical protein